MTPIRGPLAPLPWWLFALALGALLFVGAGCTTPQGVIADLPRNLTCRGKATLVGSGSGFAGLNGSIDCGDGFELHAGPDLPPPAPSP